MGARGIGALALLSLLAAAGDAPAGTSTEKVAGVTVYRGPGSGPLPKPATEPAAPRALAGERLWLVDDEAGEVVSCRNVGTANVGERRVRCTRALLPD